MSGLVWPDTQSSTGADAEMSVMDHGAVVEPRDAPPDGVTVHIKSMGAGSWSDRLYLDALEKQVCPKPETLSALEVRRTASILLVLRSRSACELACVCVCVCVLEKQGVSMRMRIEGPYGHMGVDLSKYSHILNISGGIGFTPCAVLLQLVLDPPRRHKCLPVCVCGGGEGGGG